eukprot:COSAG06_NODE_2086_length_7632_cov_22.212133_17_plen_159_part_00
MATTSVITYNQILAVWKQIADNHQQVKTFTHGDIFEVDANTVVFPQVHLITEQASISKHELTYSFKLIAMDLVEPDESNEDEVLSDCLQYIQDFIAVWKNGVTSASPTFTIDSQDYRISENVSCNPFTERFDTRVSGWVGDFSISVDYSANACVVPIN